MSAVYDNWDRLVRDTLRREDLRRTGLRTPSDVSLASYPSFAQSSSFNFDSISPSDYQVSSSLHGDSFTYHQILQATDSFSRSNFIQNGRSGDFFYGVLEGGEEVVVKKVDFSSALQVSLWKSETKFFAKVCHPKFVPLLGHCLENRKHKFLVYKYMPNRDLFTSLYQKTDRADGSVTPVDWKSRLKVATGVAEALNHLHHECLPPLVHRNVEASSILIDENYHGHLGRNTEVCTEKIHSNRSSISKFLRLPTGSHQGAPDASNATCAYDVYCFAKVLLELITGYPVDIDSRAPNSMEKILPYITTYDKELFLNIMDPCLAMDMHLLKEVWAVAVVAKVCLSAKPTKRPLMKNVLGALEVSKLEEFSTLLSSSSSNYLTQVVPLEKMTLPGGSELGKPQVKLSAIFANGGIAFWSSQSLLAASGIEGAYRHDEDWGLPCLMEFKFAQLRAATKNFSSDSLVGEDAFGKVYKGFHPKKSASIAVRRRAPEDFSHFNRFEVWQTEIEMLRRLSHPNLIKLYGYCSEDRELLIVYEYMPKGSLQNHLFGRGSSIQPLSWHLRLKILVGAARGLAFLHASKRGVILRDFQTSSILLDSSYNAKLTGFGLAKMGPPEDETHLSTMVMGTGTGYADPEYIRTGHLCVNSDVYSFGVVMVEVLTGLRAIDPNRSKQQHNLVDRVKAYLSGGLLLTIMDARLQRKYPEQSAVKVAQLAQACLSTEPKDRPSMKQVMETLEGIEQLQ